MATENGRKLFPELIGRIVQDQPANLVLFQFKEEITFERIFLMGKEIQPPAPETKQCEITKFQAPIIK